MADPVNCNGLSIGSGHFPDIPQMSDLCLYSPAFREQQFSEVCGRRAARHIANWSYTVGDE